MKPKEKIGKALWNICESCKDVVTKNFVKAVQEGTIKIDDSQLEPIVSLLNALIEQSFHLAFNTFMRTVEGAIQSVDSRVPPT